MLGFSVWFPAFSPVVFRNNGLQLAPIIAGMLIVVATTNLSEFRLNKNLLMLTVGWLFLLMVSTLFSPHPEQALRGCLLLLSGLVVMYSSYLLGRQNGGWRAFLLGFTAGGILSSLYAGYQLTAFRLGWPGGTLLNNNPSFPSYANSPWLEELGRSFAFTPEPSVLSSLLIPLFVVVFGKLLSGKERLKITIVLAILGFGLVCSSSMAIILTLPLSMLWFLAGNWQLRKKLGEFRRLLTIVVLATLISLMVLNFNGFNWQVGQRADAILNYLATGEELAANSILVRFFAGAAAIQMFFERPILGWGLFATDPDFEEKIPSWILSFEQKSGVDSWILGFAMWQGIAGLVLLCLLIYLALNKSRGDWQIQAVLIGVIVTISLQTGYLLLYHVWAIFGLALASKNNSNKTELTT